MDEENVNKGQGIKEQLNKGAKKLGAQTAKKVFKKIIAVILPILLKVLIPILIVYVIISSISNFLDINKGDNSKKSSSSAIYYGSTEKNKISIDINNVKDGGYKLTYEFEDENGESITEEEAIKKIKSDLLQANREIDLSKFTESELKIIGSLMYNGLETEEYNEEQLKALAIFVKADIASHIFKLGSGSSSKVNIEKVRETDEIDGTIEIHKTTSTENGYTQKKLDYVEYTTFTEMISEGNKDVLDKFSVDDKDNLVIAKSSARKITYTYQGVDGTELSDADMGKIGEESIGENVDDIQITEFSVPINYKQYIEKYIAGYGFLSDLLITTNNVDFCLDIAELALNSKIVFNICEEQTITKIYSVTKYSQTNLEYDYVDYEVKEYDITEKTVASGSGSPSDSSIPSSYGWNSGLSHTTTGTTVKLETYSWRKNGESYTLTYNTSSNTWTLTKKEKNEATTSKESGSQTLIVGGHITESYDGYTIDEDYTSKAEFSYKVIEETIKMDYKYDIDLSEIDCWYVSYKKTYASPKEVTTVMTPPESIPGQFPQEATVNQEATSDSGIIDSNTYVTAFKMQKENKYKDDGVDEVECTIKSLTIKTKTKADSQVEEYNGKIITYSFGEENDGDTTQTNLKNVEYVNDIPTFTAKGSKGILYIYDQYLNAGIDLHMKNDAEKKLFELLESNKETENISDIMKFLLYVYDGIDRGGNHIKPQIGDLNEFTKLKGSSTENFIKAWENGGLWLYETGQSDYFPGGYLSADEKYYICFEDGSPGHNNISYGLMTYLSTENGSENHPIYGKGQYNAESIYEAAGINVRELYEGAYVDKEAADSVFYGMLKGHMNTSRYSVNTLLETNLPEYKFSQAQKDALCSISWQYGSILGFDEVYKRAVKEDGTFDPEIIAEFKGMRYKDEYGNKDPRQYANWLLFTTGKYIDFRGEEMSVGNGLFVDTAYEVAAHFLESGVDIYYAGNNNPSVEDNGIRCTSLEGSWDAPISNPDVYGLICDTFVNLTIWKTGLYEAKDSNWIYMPEKFPDEWEIVDSYEELEAGDIVFMTGHVYIYVGDDKAIDQNYCTIATGGLDIRGKLIDINISTSYRTKFIRGYRYIG